MPAGMNYNLNPIETDKEIWNVETIFRLSGGFNLVTTNLTSGNHLPAGTPLAVDFSTRKATAVKNVKVYEAATAEATEYKVEKNSLAYVGMFLGNGTKGMEVSAIDTSNADYDVITVEATLGVAVAIGKILFEASASGGTTVKNTANALNYARTKIESGATVSVVGKVFEIFESELEVPVSDKDKDNLGARFLFV